MPIKHSLALLLGALSIALSTASFAGAKEECEEWARGDNVSAMLWDRYVDSCISSMQGEEMNENTGEEDPPEPDSAAQEPSNTEADRAY